MSSASLRMTRPFSWRTAPRPRSSRRREQRTPWLPAKRLANWVTGEYLRLAKGEGGGHAVERVTGEQLAALVRLVEDGQLSGTNAKEVFARHAATGQAVDAIVADAGLRRISDEGALTAAVREVVAANPGAVADVRAGKAQAIGFLVGQVMKATRGQADAAAVAALVRAAIDEDAAS